MCSYSFGYTDGSRINGILAYETVKFGMTNGHMAAVIGILFRRWNNNFLHFGTDGGSDIVGLGGVPLSLISQFGSEVEKKFSDCLPNSANITIKVRFRKHAAIMRHDNVSTPLLHSLSHLTPYFLSLEAISVGGELIRTRKIDGCNANTIIDLGATLNFFEFKLCKTILAAIIESIGPEAIADPESTFDLCCSTNSFTERTMVFHFNGADMALKRINLFIAVDNLTCLAMKPSSNRFNIFGSMGQLSF